MTAPQSRRESAAVDRRECSALRAVIRHGCSSAAANGIGTTLKNSVSALCVTVLSSASRSVGQESPNSAAASERARLSAALPSLTLGQLPAVPSR